MKQTHPTSKEISMNKQAAKALVRQSLQDMLFESSYSVVQELSDQGWQLEVEPVRETGKDTLTLTVRIRAV